MRRSVLRPSHRFGAAALVVAVVVLPAGAQQAAANTAAAAGGAADSVEVTEVELRGRESLDADVIEEAIATHASSCRSALAAPLCLLGFDYVRLPRFLDTVQVALDIERIATVYEINGYPGTTVDARIERDGPRARVVFLIDESEPYRVRSLEVIGMPAGLARPRELPLEVGDVYGLPALDATIERIEFLLARHGYPYAAVAADGSIDEPSRTGSLTLRVDSGIRARFGEVTMRVDAPLEPAFIEDRLAFEPGQPYDPLLLERTERRLYELEATGRAIVRVERLRDSASVLPVVVEVSPGRLRGLEAEGTLSTTDCFEAAGFWTHRHLYGRPRVARVGVTLSNLLADRLDGGFPCSDTGSGEYARLDYHAIASLDEPIAGTAATWARVELFAERHSAPDVFVEHGFGGSLALSRQPSDDLGFALEYRPRRFELEAVELYLCGNYGACELDALQSLGGPRWLAPLTASVVWMSDGELQGVTRDKLSLWRLEPLPRFRTELRGAVEAAGDWSLSDHAYQRALAQAAATRRFGSVWEIAARLRGGALFTDDVLPPRVRLFAGGPSSVRGAQQNLLGPATLVADPRDLERIGCAPPPDGCAPGTAAHPDLVRLRPLGGRSLVEAGLEARWSFAPRAQAAGFVDFGWVASPEDEGGGDEWMIAPGIGVRLVANIGAIRIDLAFDPRGSRTLPLHSALASGEIEDLGDVRYDPFTYDDPGFLREAWRRMQLHFAVGQAF